MKRGESKKGDQNKNPRVLRIEFQSEFKALMAFKKSGIHCLFEALYLVPSEVLLLHLVLV